MLKGDAKINMKIKIMEYNVLHGFHEMSPPFKFEKERLEYAKILVKSENPDILIITEACYGGEAKFGKFLNYKKIFNYRYGFFGPYGEFEWGNMILSKFQIDCELIKLKNRTAIRSAINIKKGTQIYIDVIHTSPDLPESGKIESTKALLDNLIKPYIIAGDFNAVSDEDNYDRDILIEGYKAFAGNKAEEKVDRLLGKKFIPFIKSFGLRDAFDNKSRDYTIPTSLAVGDKKSAVRIDHFFISDDIKVIKTYVVKNAIAEKASDHYPIVGIFEIE